MFSPTSKSNSSASSLDLLAEARQTAADAPPQGTGSRPPSPHSQHSGNVAFDALKSMRRQSTTGESSETSGPRALRVTASALPEGSPQVRLRRQSASSDDWAEVLDQTRQIRTEMSDLHRSIGEAHPDMKQLQEFFESGVMPSDGTAAAFIEKHLKDAEALGEVMAQQSTFTPAQHIEAMTKSLGDTVARAEADMLDGDGNPVTSTREHERAAQQIASFISTGTVAGPSFPPPSPSGALLRHPASEADLARLSTEIQTVARSLVPSGEAPTEIASGLGLALAEQLDVPGAARAVRAAQALTSAIESLGNGISPSAAMRTLSRALGVTTTSLKKGIAAIAANEFESPAATLAASVTNVAARNAASVLVPTVIRQMLSAQIERGLDTTGASDQQRAVLGGAFMLLPVLLLASGSIRDHKHGTATMQSDIARGMMASMSLAFLLGGIFTRQLGGSASQMVAFTLYTFMRDIAVQSHLRLTNPNTEGKAPDAHHWNAISWGYGIDQAIVNWAMPTAAPTSGPSAYLAHMGGHDQFKAALIRGGINWGGEIAEDLMFNGIPAVRDKKMLRLGLQEAGVRGRHVANGLLAPMAVRTAITQSNVIISDIIDKFYGTSDPTRALYLTAGLAGGVLNAGWYWPFANAGAGQPPVSARISEVEAGSPQEEVHQFTVPDVDMTDARSIRSTAASSEEARTDLELRNRSSRPA